MVHAGIPEPARVARAMYARLGAGIFELLWLAGARESRLRKVVREHAMIEPELERAIEDALARGPVVFGASHTGNWEIAAHAAAMLVARSGRKLSVVVKPMAVGAFDAFCKRLRARLGITLVAPDGALDEARAAIAQGDAVAMMIDQVPDRAKHGTTASFLGREALCDRAPAVLAKRTGATFIVVAARRVGSHHRVTLLDVLDARETSVVELTRAATAALDRFVRAEPAEWLWLHRRWREPRERRSAKALDAMTTLPAR